MIPKPIETYRADDSFNSYPGPSIRDSRPEAENLVEASKQGATGCGNIQITVLQMLGSIRRPLKGTLLNPTSGSLTRDLIERVYIPTFPLIYG